jgi:hypothetical protein
MGSRQKVILTTWAAGSTVDAVRHRHALAAAVALTLVLGLLLVGRARAGEDVPWRPSPTDTWQYQLAGRIDLTADADVFDVDAFTTHRVVVDALHARGRRVVCYLDAGSWEAFRPDAHRFPRSLLGKRVPGWPDERWLDIRRLDLLRPIMRDRLDRCARKGFDGVEFDWVDSFAFDTGFPLSRADQLRYDRWLAAAAHRRGLAVGLKNGLDLVRTLVDRYDFAINEQCFQYHECGRYRPFLDAGMAVLNVEYELPRAAFCARAADLGIAAMRKRLNLGAWRAPC